MGFSLIGMVIVVVIFLPNLLCIKYPPKNIPENLKDVSPFITLLENIGRIAFFIILIFSKNNYHNIEINLWSVLMIINILVYYGLWFKYVVKGKYFYLLFEPLCIIPIPMAVFPVLAFGFTALWGSSVYLGIAAVVFAIAHFVNSWNSYIRTKSA